MDRAQDSRVEIQAIVEAICGPVGLEVVDVSIGKSDRKWHIRIDIDRAGPNSVGVDDCQRISRAVEAALDDRDLINDSYTLEVSSPGIDRPIRTEDDIRRNTGRRIVVETIDERCGRRSFNGVLMGFEGGSLRLREDDGEEEIMEIEMSNVVRAHQELPF